MVKIFVNGIEFNISQKMLECCELLSNMEEISNYINVQHEDIIPIHVEFIDKFINHYETLPHFDTPNYKSVNYLLGNEMFSHLEKLTPLEMFKLMRLTDLIICESVYGCFAAYVAMKIDNDEKYLDFVRKM